MAQSLASARAKNFLARFRWIAGDGMNFVMTENRCSVPCVAHRTFRLGRVRTKVARFKGFPSF